MFNLGIFVSLWT